MKRITWMIAAMAVLLPACGDDGSGAPCDGAVCADAADRCADVTCDTGLVCAPATGQCEVCSGASCEPGDPCLDDNGGCDPLTDCTEGTQHEAICGACPAGYTGTGADGCVVTALPDLGTSIVAISFTDSGLSVLVSVYNDGAAWAGGELTFRFVDTGEVAPAVDTASGHTATVTAAALGAGESDDYTLLFPANTSAVEGQAWVIVDATQVFEEADDANNVSNGIPWGLPDLVVELTRLTLRGGSVVDAEFDIINHGISGVDGAVRMALWENPATTPTAADSPDDAQWLELPFPLRGLDGRATTELSFSVERLGGRAFLRANHAPFIPETTTANNTSGAAYWGTADRPDLRVSVNSVTPTTGSNATVDFTIYNDGPRPASPSTFYIRAMNAAAPPERTDFTGNYLLVPVGTIPAGGSVTTSLLVTIFYTPNGTLYLLADASPDFTNGNVTEANENNNVSPGFAWGASVARPDLRVTLDSITDLGNGTATVAYTVLNAGTAPVNGSQVQLDFYEHRTTAPTASTPPQHSFTAPAGVIAAAGNVSASAVVPIGCLIARSFLYVDRTAQVAESNEANNVSAGLNRTPPSPSPNLAVRIENVTTFNGEAIRVYYTVTNLGPGVSDGCQLGLALYPGATAAPVPGASSDYYVSIPTTPIAPSSTRSGSFPVSGLASGTLYLVVNGEGIIPEVTLSNNVSTGLGW